jgi:hypothetical protein
MESPFATLPPDLLLYISGFLDICDAARAARTCMAAKNAILPLRHTKARMPWSVSATLVNYRFLQRDKTVFLQQLRELTLDVDAMHVRTKYMRELLGSRLERLTVVGLSCWFHLERVLATVPLLVNLVFLRAEFVYETDDDKVSDVLERARSYLRDYSPTGTGPTLNLVELVGVSDVRFGYRDTYGYDSEDYDDSMGDDQRPRRMAASAWTIPQTHVPEREDLGHVYGCECRGYAPRCAPLGTYPRTNEFQVDGKWKGLVLRNERSPMVPKLPFGARCEEWVDCHSCYIRMAPSGQTRACETCPEVGDVPFCSECFVNTGEHRNPAAYAVEYVDEHGPRTKYLHDPTCHGCGKDDKTTVHAMRRDCAREDEGCQNAFFCRVCYFDLRCKCPS